ncbi:MAG: 30S ribosomal protein S7 [Candidatus Sigynarchaeum springense]
MQEEAPTTAEAPKAEPEPAAEAPKAELEPAKTEPVQDEESPVVEEFETVTGTNILLFGRWPTNVTIHDKGLQRYINLRDIGVPHMSGLYQKKRFWKHKQSIVERLATRMMTPGTIRARIKGKRTSCRAGKKQKVLNIIRRSFELINLKTGENPVQVYVNAIEHAALREDTTRISMGGISYQSSVDVAPARRVDMAIHLIALGASRRSHNSPVTIEECLTDEILAAAKGDSSSFAVSRKEEKERIAFSAR